MTNSKAKYLKSLSVGLQISDLFLLKSFNTCFTMHTQIFFCVMTVVVGYAAQPFQPTDNSYIVLNKKQSKCIDYNFDFKSCHPCRMENCSPIKIRYNVNCNLYVCIEGVVPSTPTPTPTPTQRTTTPPTTTTTTTTTAPTTTIAPTTTSSTTTTMENSGA